jgi:elongation factor G
MDKLGADFYFTVKTIIDRLGAKPLVIQLPIGAENEFEGVIDLVEMRALTWRGDVEMGTKYEIEPIPENMQAKADEYRAQLIEAVADTSDELMEKYFNGTEMTVAEIKEAIRKLTVNSAAYPILCGSAFKNKGVQPMLDAVLDYLPSPLDVASVEGGDPRDEEKRITRKPDVNEPFAALAFKVVTHPFFGRLTYIRVYSGKANAGDAVANSTKGRKERIGKVFQMHANKEIPISGVTAGHIYAAIGLKDTTTGDTLCDLDNQIVLESMTFPEPVISVAIEPKTKSDQEKLGMVLNPLHQYVLMLDL